MAFKNKGILVFQKGGLNEKLYVLMLTVNYGMNIKYLCELNVI